MTEQPKFKDLPKRIQEKVRDKARWERMTLSAVIKEWPNILEGKDETRS